MENLHEMGYRMRELKKKQVRLAVELVGFLLLIVWTYWSVTTIDRLDRELAAAQNARPDTVLVGVKRATLNDGDVVLRIGVVGDSGRSGLCGRDGQGGKK